MLSPKTKRNISRIIPFGVIWFLSGVIFTIVEYSAAENTGLSSASAINKDLSIFIFGITAITAVGLLVGVIELLYMHDRFEKQSFARKIIYKSFVYLIILYVVTFITFPIAASLELNAGIFDRMVWQKLINYLSSITHFSTNVQLGTALLVSLFYAEISENIGYGILRNFFTGKYHQPTEEERIFMFLDMKSSTTIAEKLGHIKYFELLKEYYDAFSDPVIDHSGEVYQYIGDEIVISWRLQNGLQNNNCIKCYFAMKNSLAEKSEHYHKKYGVAPDFKAGLHFGKVTTGEIGALKKEIIFTGDVLNTTSRIQGLCKDYKVDFIISGMLIKKIKHGKGFEFRSLGKQELRGKAEPIELFTISAN